MGKYALNGFSTSFDLQNTANSHKRNKSSIQLKKCIVVKLLRFLNFSGLHFYCAALALCSLFFKKQNKKHSEKQLMWETFLQTGDLARQPITDVGKGRWP